MSRSSDHTGSELPPATLSLWGDPPVATSTLTRFARILKNNCGSAHRASKQIIQSIGCSRDVNNCILAIYSFEFSPISSQAEISKCDMVATNGVAHQVGKDFINRVQTMPRKETSTSIEELERQKRLFVFCFKRLMLCCCPVRVVEDKPRWLKN